MVEMAFSDVDFLTGKEKLSPNGLTWKNEEFIRLNIIANDPDTYFKEHPEESVEEFWRNLFIEELKLDPQIKKAQLEFARQVASQIRMGRSDASIEAIMKDILNRAKGGVTYLPGRRMNQHGN